ncbi:MAG: GWxTD domain-containing protein [Bacteroidetes bacterium]|nr:GWxTD domain-containing protein [Bacteroidota bacterium]
MKLQLSLMTGLIVLFTNLSTEAKNIPFTIDGAQFQYDNTHDLWEFYYSFPDTALRYIQITDSKKYIGSLHITVQINSISSGIVEKKEWIVDNYSDTIIRSHNRNLIGQKSFILLPGQYSVDVEINDMNDTASRAKTSLQLLIKSFVKNSIAISDIELATQILSQQSNNLVNLNPSFLKNTLFVVPNPNHEFIGTAPVLSVYSEIYNAKIYARDSIRIEYKIIDGAKREQFIAQFYRVVISDGQVETTSLPLDGLASGVYYLQLSVQSIHNSVDKATALKKFYVLNPEMPVELAPTLSEDELFHISEFATLSEERVEEEFTKAKVLASQAEVQLYESLSENVAKQKFLYRFWKERDPKPETPENEKLDDFRKAIKHANTYYSNILIKEGWKSDPGRVLLKYGFPSQIDRHSQNSETKPYEEWFYNNIQGGISFQFVDLKGYGNYIQVNSNAIGESRNEKWFEQYVKMFESKTDEEMISTPR